MSRLILWLRANLFRGRSEREIDDVELTEKIARAVAKTRFKPGTRDGRPVQLPSSIVYVK